MARFTDQVAIVTGAGSGLGRATARRLADEGARVAVLDLDAGAADEAATEIGDAASAHAVDVSDFGSVEAAVAWVVEGLGSPSVLVNCAGIGKFVKSEEESPESWNRIIGVNLTGTFFMCRAVLPHLLERAAAAGKIRRGDEGGVIVNVASNAGLMGQPYSAAYCASKGGVVNLTRALGVEYRAKGVRVNAVAPGGMKTPMISTWGFPEGAKPEEFAGITSPIGSSAPEEVAGLIAFVASEEGRYMIGNIVSMDGGITCG